MRDGELLCLGWPTLLSYLRIVTHPSIVSRPLAPAEAAANVEARIGLPHVRCLAEEEGFWDVYREVTAPIAGRGNLVPDPHPAALLRQHGAKTRSTQDRYFRKFH